MSNYVFSEEAMQLLLAVIFPHFIEPEPAATCRGF
jgi:hypothetical protein